MRVVFNLHNVGLGNNGGSRTLILCAETMQSLGVQVYLYSNCSSRYSWHKPNVKLVNKVPECDVMIATGYKSVPHVLRSHAKHKFYYIRGFELWQANEAKLLESYRSLKCIVNSEWLLNYFGRHGISSELIYPGLDFNWFQNRNTTRTKLGGLFHSRHLTKRADDVMSIARLVGGEVFMINKDAKNCTNSEMTEMYNSIRVWIAPTELEGLHNPPMEASLCGCALVCTDHPRSGMSDYAVHRKTALLYPARNLEVAAAYVKELMCDDDLAGYLNNNMVSLLREKIGTRKENMLKMLHVISK